MSKTTLAKVLSFLALGLFALALVPQSGSDARASWKEVASATPQFAATASGLPLAMLPPQGGGGYGGSGGSGGTGGGGGLPSSALSAPSARCSVEAPGPPDECSAGGSTQGMRVCSIACDGNGACSAFNASSSGTPVYCSTLAHIRAGCSVLQPGATSNPGDAWCSAISTGGDSAARCSASGPTGTPSLCSVRQGFQNPRYWNECSAWNYAPAAQNLRCSVLGPRGPKNACSSFSGSAAGTGKVCSAFSAKAQCSVKQDAQGMVNGKCTSLRLAPANTCSVIGTSGGECSIIGGPGGDPCGSH